MKFSTYAEVFTPDHPLWKAYQDGLKKTPGHLLRDVLRETGGRYEVMTEVPRRLREKMLQVADLGADSELAAAANATWVPVSLEHLRGHDPDTTRIVYGCRVDSEPGDPKVFDS